MTRELDENGSVLVFGAVCVFNDGALQRFFIALSLLNSKACARLGVSREMLYVNRDTCDNYPLYNRGANIV